MLSYSYDHFWFRVKFLCSVKNLIRSYLVKKTYGEYAPSDVFFRLVQSMRILRTNFCQSACLCLLFVCLPVYSCFLSVSFFSFFLSVGQSFYETFFCELTGEFCCLQFRVENTGCFSGYVWSVIFKYF